VNQDEGSISHTLHTHYFDNRRLPLCTSMPQSSWIFLLVSHDFSFIYYYYFILHVSYTGMNTIPSNSHGPCTLSVTFKIQEDGPRQSRAENL